MHFNTYMVTVCVISVYTHQHVDLKLWINALLYFTIHMKYVHLTAIITKIWTFDYFISFC